MSPDATKIHRVLCQEFGLTPDGYSLEPNGHGSWRFQLLGVKPPTKPIYGACTRSMIRAIRRRFNPVFVEAEAAESNDIAV